MSEMQSSRKIRCHSFILESTFSFCTHAYENVHVQTKTEDLSAMDYKDDGNGLLCLNLELIHCNV